MKRIRRKRGGGANWMDTYGDMVTLLLCFFVMLYSISTIDTNKWISLVRSFNPDAVSTATETPGGDGPDADSNAGEGLDITQAEIDSALDELYESLRSYAADQAMDSTMDITRGAGYVFVSFNETVFFAGESWELQAEGKVVLDYLCSALDNAAPFIDEVRVLGHTAQGDPRKPNRITVDRFLSSNRATVSLVYIQEHSSLDPARLVSEGYGQFRPVADNDTGEGRSRNRRVEVIITALELNQLNDALGGALRQYYALRGDEAPPDESEPSDVS